MSTNHLFRLSRSFLRLYKNKKPNFGYNGLGELVYRRTYSRMNLNTGIKENWNDTVQRVVEGTFNLQKRHFVDNEIPGWSQENVTPIAEKMFDLIYNMKFLPSGRGLWAMGTSLTEEKGLYSALNNCAFVSTQNIDTETSRPFEFTMDALMLGVGVGFDTRGANKTKIYKPSTKKRKYIIQDDRESWVESTKLLLDSYFKPNLNSLYFDYSLIRPAGLQLKTFGGTSSGPQPLIDLHSNIIKILDQHTNQSIGSKTIADIMNLIGKCVVAGNVRRSSQIALGDPQDDVFLNLKNYNRYPERKDWGWCSNNSILADQNTDYNILTDTIQKSGEPGVFWLDNARKYGRMGDPVNNKDYRAMGVNPCGEQTLESYELCNLVEVFMNRNHNLPEFLQTLEFAFLYAKIVTLGLPDESVWNESHEVISRNRRIGTSLSSIYEFYQKNGKNKTIKWFDQGYQRLQKADKVYSRQMKVPTSIKTTTVKPSGTISLLTGSTPGIHAPVGGRHYIRRVQMSEHDSNLSSILEAGYKVEASVATPNAVVVEFPSKINPKLETQDKQTIEEQFELAALAQRYWSDNQVSCTVAFNKNEEEKIAPLLKEYQNKLKGISLLPRSNDEYAQMPYETITESEYKEMRFNISKIEWDSELKTRDAEPEKYCSNQGCQV